MPRPIYTDPEIAGVGLTEAQARELHGDDVAVGVFPWVANARAVMQAETVGWVKSIHETKYGELLGIVMVGPHVTDLIEAGTVAIDAESTVETVADGMAAHPTLSEAIKEAGLVALGRAIHMPNKKRAAAKAWNRLRRPARARPRDAGRTVQTSGTSRTSSVRQRRSRPRRRAASCRLRSNRTAAPRRRSRSA